jgi:RNA recognition motif-containing protein
MTRSHAASDERYGTLDRVNLVRDRDTGRSHGFAFVEMSDAAQADQAIKAAQWRGIGRTGFER